MILGTQWYILFNVIAGASAFPSDLKEAAQSFHVKGWRWWRNVILPGIFPYYVTGAITAAGGSWNASIVAEAASWGDTKLGRRRPWILHRTGDRSRGLSEGGPRHRRHVHLRHPVQSFALATALRLWRASLPPRLIPGINLSPRGHSCSKSHQNRTAHRYPGRLPQFSEGKRWRSPGAGQSQSDYSSQVRSSDCSAGPALASRRCCASSRGSSRHPRARSVAVAKPSKARPKASRWCFSPSRSFRG